MSPADPFSLSPGSRPVPPPSPEVRSEQHHRTMEQHRAAILSHVLPLETEVIPVDVDSLSRTLATDHTVINAIPPFDNSAMDGFLMHRADLNPSGTVTLDVMGDVAAGDAPRIPSLGSAVRIMTGAPVDTSTADLVIVPVEYTNIAPGPQALPEKVQVNNFDAAKLHIRRKGESLQVGSRCANAGQQVDIGLLSTLISAGIAEVEAYKAPRVAVISTGKELRPTGAALAPGKIPDSNSPMIAALVRAWGPSQTTIVHSDDSPEQLRELFEHVGADHDLIITTGGVAVGVYDVVREVLVNHTAQAWFGRVEHKPGSHQGFSVWATNDGRSIPVVSLPGNPVAAFISFALYVQPVLDKLGGHTETAKPRKIEAQLMGKAPAGGDRDVFIPAIVDFTTLPTTVTPFNGRHVGSHMISALVGVNSILHVVSGDRPHSEGDMVEVTLLPTITG